MNVSTCPCCLRSIPTLDAVQAKRSSDEGRIVREPTFTYHFDQQSRECRGSRKTLVEADAIAFPSGK